jgi:signal transduction histidine kinase
MVEKVDRTVIIAMQMPVVLSLFVLSIQAYKTLRIKGFYFLAAGFFVNLLYLLFSFFFLKSENADECVGLVTTSIFDLFTTYFFLLSSIRVCTKKKLDRTFYFWTVIVFIACGIPRMFPHDPKTDLIPYILVRNIPDALLDFAVLGLVAIFLRGLSRKYHQSKLLSILLFGGTGLYAITQLLAMLQEDSFTMIYMYIDTIGFVLGLLSKIAMLIGVSILLIGIGKEYVVKEELATKLDDILGKTFHEITYPLNGLNGYIAEITADDKKRGLSHLGLKDSVDHIETSYQHMLAIVSASMKMYERDMGKAFANDFIQISRNESEERVSVNTLIQIAILKIKSIMYEEIVFNCDYGGNCIIQCDSNQMIQVFLNLFKNSYEAMKGETGSIRIKTRIHKYDPENESGKYIKVEIADNGYGVDESVKDRIFEIGATTKSLDGKNRGYGMAVVKEIVISHRGTIEIQSPIIDKSETSRLGTLITLTFPRAEIL